MHPWNPSGIHTWQPGMPRRAENGHAAPPAFPWVGKQTRLAPHARPSATPPASPRSLNLPDGPVPSFLRKTSTPSSRLSRPCLTVGVPPTSAAYSSGTPSTGSSGAYLQIPAPSRLASGVSRSSASTLPGLYSTTTGLPGAGQQRHSPSRDDTEGPGDGHLGIQGAPGSRLPTPPDRDTPRRPGLLPWAARGTARGKTRGSGNLGTHAERRGRW